MSGLNRNEPKMEYLVHSKKNKKPDDYIYVLVNSEKRKTSFDMKDIVWDYVEEIDPLSTPKESEPPFKE